MGIVTIEAIREHYDSMVLLYRLSLGASIFIMVCSSAATSDRDGHKSKRSSSACSWHSRRAPRRWMRVSDMAEPQCTWRATSTRVTAITSSRKQAEFTKRLARRNGVRDLVEFVVADAKLCLPRVALRHRLDHGGFRALSEQTGVFQESGECPTGTGQVTGLWRGPRPAGQCLAGS
jgi:hypothetical protein